MKPDEIAPIKTLLLDDDKFLLDLYVSKFTKEGFVVQAALSVDDALIILRNGFQADVVLFDLVMPNKDGFIFLQEIEKDQLVPSALLIALSNGSTADLDSEKKRVIALGGDYFVIKASMIPSEVVNMVRKEIQLQHKA